MSPQANGRALTVHRTTEAEMRAICAWRYGGAYAVYDPQPYEEQIRQGRGFGSPRNSFYSFCDGEELVGYIHLAGDASEVRFGIAVHPARCGRGYGQAICRMACDLSRRLYPGKPIRLLVRTWNERAVRCYSRAGFRIIGEPVALTTPAGEGEFFRMEAEDGSGPR